MRPTDLDGIAAIEQGVLSPWHRAALEQELNCPNGLQLVAEDDVSGEILGWCCGRQIGPEAELLKISVLPARRQCGIATILLTHLVQEFAASGAAILFLEVRAGNLPARQLYRKHCFNETGLRKKYYTDPEDDALIFAKDLL